MTGGVEEDGGPGGAPADAGGIVLGVSAIPSPEGVPGVGTGLTATGGAPEVPGTALVIVAALFSAFG